MMWRLITAILLMCEWSGAAWAAEHTVYIAYNNFSPRQLVIAAGDKVTWVHQSSFDHTVTDDINVIRDPTRAKMPLGSQPFTSNVLGYQESFSHTFTDIGVYRYTCAIHEYMVGEITVVDANK